jgi:hypothetical protein
MWRRLFGLADIPKPWLRVLISYGNGHGPQSFESHMPIQATFGWRLLHRLFIENNTVNDNADEWYYRGFLPRNAQQLYLTMALEVVRAGAE